MKKGITIVTLSAVVLILIIITTTVTITGTNAINNSKKVKFASELVVVREAVLNYSNLNEGSLPAKKNEDNTNIIKIVEGKSGIQINMDLLNMIDTTYGRELYGDDDVYVVTPSNEIYYLKGLEIGGKNYYTLDDELKKIIGYDKFAIEENRNGIIFSKSTAEYTNQAITTNIKIPKKYNVEYVRVNNDIINLDSSNNEYNLYQANVKNNYYVEIKYKYNDDILTQGYYVGNYDNEAPEIKVSCDVIENNDEVYNNVIFDVTDNLSGVDRVLYAEDEQTVDYFDSKGTLITSKSINIDSKIKKITILAVDKAGNKNIVVKNLEANKKSNVDDYVKYGLMVHYDAIDNTGKGHKDDTLEWKDLSGHGNNGILRNINNSWGNNYLKFDGIDDWVSIGELNYEKITLQAVVSYDNISNSESSVIPNIQNGGYGIQLHNQKNEFVCNLVAQDSYNVASTEIIQVNKKYSLSASYNGNVIKLFQNGNFVKKNISGEINFPEPSTILCLGTNPSDNNVFFNGKIYSIRVYNRDLTEEEVKRNYEIDKIRFGI